MDAAHAAGALVCVDNSFMSPLWQRPLELGADLSMMSGTKYFGGHSDVTLGTLAVRDEELTKRIYFLQASVTAARALAITSGICYCCDADIMRECLDIQLHSLQRQLWAHVTIMVSTHVSSGCILLSSAAALVGMIAWYIRC